MTPRPAGTRAQGVRLPAARARRPTGVRFGLVEDAPARHDMASASVTLVKLDYEITSLLAAPDEIAVRTF